MPGGDGTGPMGMGPMTGRAAGYCAGYPVPGFMNPVGGYGGRGFGGRGGGRGWRNWYYRTGMSGWMRWGYGYPAFGGSYPPAAGVNPAGFAGTMNKDQELEMLRGQAEYFTSALENLKERMAALEKESESK